MDVHFYIHRGEYSKAMVILVWKYHKKPLLFGVFFPLQTSYFNLGSTHQFMTDTFTLFFSGVEFT